MPAVYPSNFSVTALNTSALTVSWSHIDEDLWQGVPLGYVIYCNHSNDQRNFSVMLSSEEIMITNLTVFTFYDLTMVGYTRKGLGPKHPMVTVRTHEEGNVRTFSMSTFSTLARSLCTNDSRSLWLNIRFISCLASIWSQLSRPGLLALW